MRISELIKKLKDEEPDAEILLSENGLAIIPRRIPWQIKCIYQLPKYNKEKSDIKDVQLLEEYGYGDIAYAGRNELHKIYEAMGWDWERRFSYLLSFNFGKNWCHLFVDFRETPCNKSDDKYGIEKKGWLGRDLVKVPATNDWVPENGQKSISEYEKNTDENMITIPERFKDVKYKSDRIPGVDEQSDLQLGANCQVYAYEFLKEFNIELPNFRSSELWEDTIYTKKVEGDFLPLDIMLYNNKSETYGAHVGINLGSNLILHLSKDNGIPRVETHEAMVTQLKYRYFIGAKRVLETIINNNKNKA